MANVSVYNIEGKEVGTIDLSDGQTYLFIISKVKKLVQSI